MTAIEINSQEHSIKSVTVFKSQRAEIVRVFPLELKVGRNQVEVKSLSGAIDTKSIRVSGLGNTRLLDVVCLLNSSQLPSPTDASEVTSALNRKLQALRKEKDVLADEAKILASYSKTLTGEHISPENMSSFLKAYVEQNKKNLSASAALEDAIRDVERQVKEEEIKRNMKKGPPPNGEVTMAIEAAVETNIDLKLTYIVNGATWEPMYELHATTQNGKPSSTVTLNYRARITQSTGEDWADASLTLSTSNTSMNTTISGLPSIKLRPKALHASMQQPQQQTYLTTQQPQQQLQYRMQLLQQAQQQQQQLTVPMQMMQQQQQQSQPPVPMSCASYHTHADSAPFTSAVDNEGSFNEDDFEDITPVDGKSSTSVVKDSALAVSYAVQGKSTVPSDGIAHMVSIAELDFDAEIKYVAVPRVEAVVYLQCEVKNTSEYRLLPGSVSVIFDESFVSQTSIPDISAGDTFTCTLGVDPATKITYVRRATHSDTKASTFTEAKRTTSYTVKIRITNKHAFALADIVVREALPMVDIGDQESGITGSNKARVILRKPLGLADAKVGEDLALDGQKVTANAEGDFRVRWQKAEGGQLGGDKDGKFEWFGGLKMGEKVELEAGWDIKTPEDVKWVEVNRPW